jgi:hypothetical protein
MKKIISLILIFSIFSIISGFATEQEAIDNLVAYASAAIVTLQNQGYYVEVPENAGQVFYLKTGQYIKIDGTFYKGTNYVIVGSGDSSAVDVNIEVYDANWNLIFNENSKGVNSDVILTPNYTADMHVMVKLVSTKSGKAGAYVGFMLFYIQ